MGFPFCFQFHLPCDLISSFTNFLCSSLFVCLLSKSTACLQKHFYFIFFGLWKWYIKLESVVACVLQLPKSCQQIRYIHILIDGSFGRTIGTERPKMPNRIFFIHAYTKKVHFLFFFLFLFVFCTQKKGFFFWVIGKLTLSPLLPWGALSMFDTYHRCYYLLCFWLSLDGFYKESHAGSDQLSNWLIVTFLCLKSNYSLPPKSAN